MFVFVFDSAWQWRCIVADWLAEMMFTASQVYLL